MNIRTKKSEKGLLKVRVPIQLTHQIVDAYWTKLTSPDFRTANQMHNAPPRYSVRQFGKWEKEKKKKAWWKGK